MERDIWLAIIGVMGTLLGTILGWLLNSLSSKGNLSIYLTHWTHTFNFFGDGLKGLEKKDRVKYFNFIITLDIYNSSDSTKILRNIKIEFKRFNELIYTITPKNNKTERYSAASYHYDSVEPINVPPKTIIQYSFRESIDIQNNFPNLWDCTNIWLSYLNEDNKRKQTILRKNILFKIE